MCDIFIYFEKKNEVPKVKCQNLPHSELITGKDEQACVSFAKM